jgi:hypothetical protein
MGQENSSAAGTQLAAGVMSPSITLSAADCGIANIQQSGMGS